MSALGRAFLTSMGTAAALLVVGAAAASAAGALAVGSCGAYGVSYDFSEAAPAQTAALDQCSGDCKIVVAEMRHNCAALAVDLRNVCGALGFASAARLGIAQNTALRQCYLHGGKDCIIRAWVCDAKG